MEDTEESLVALHAFRSAWKRCVNAYSERLVNSERCLQAMLYHHLRGFLPKDYNIYVEASIKIPATSTDVLADLKSKVIVDTLICHGTDIVAAIEVKYGPKGAPESKAVQKDLKTLSLIKNRRYPGNRIDIKLSRYLGDEEPVALSINKTRKLIFAAFLRKSNERFTADQFWKSHRPNDGLWKDHQNPANLAVILAKTHSDGAVCIEEFGPAIKRMDGQRK